MRLGCRILSLLLALVLLLGTLCSCAATRRPLVYFKEAVENTVEKRFGGEIISTLLEALSGGSIAFRFGGTDLTQTPLEGTELTLWMDREHQSMAAQGSVTVGGKVYDGRLFVDPERAVATSAAFFGPVDLGVDFDTLEDDLKNSIFRNNSGTDYAMTWFGDGAAKNLTTLKDGAFALGSSVETWARLSDEIVEDFLEILVKYASCKPYSKDGSIHISLAVNNDALARTLRDLRERALKDKTFCRELRKLATTLDSMRSAINGTTTTAFENAVETFISSSAGLDVLCNRIVTSDAFLLRLETAIKRSGDVIEYATLSFDRAQSNVFTLNLDLSDQDTNVISFTREGITRKLSYQVTKDSLRYYCAQAVYQKLSADGTSLSYVTGELNADRREDHFELTFRNGEETRYFTGSFDEKIDGFEVSVDRVSVNGESKRFSLSITVDVDAAMPKAPEIYENIATVTETRFRPIAEIAGAAYSELKNAWGDAEISPYAFSDVLLRIIGIDEEVA